MPSEHPPGREVIAVEVPGGQLAVETHPSATEPVLAIHGVSSQRRLWNWLRAADPGLSLIAPDLRGRGDSAGVAGPSSMSRHAADMIAVLDRLGLAAVHVGGMSMGGFVAVELATSYPDRVKSLVLVDGGFAMAAPPGLTAEALPVVFKDRLARLDREWPSVRDYAAFFTAQTAPLLDPADIFFGTSKWQQLQVPAWLLTVRPVAGVDHAASIMTMAGARATAELIAEAQS